jgi:hypothetical protein
MVGGMSAGAAAASRFLNAFENDELGLKIKVLGSLGVSGASMLCYNYHDFYKPPAKQPDSNNPFSWWLPCGDSNNGCCPQHYTELIYHKSPPPANRHPPVMIVQGNDSNADPYAGRKYVDAMKDIGAVGFAITTSDYIHGFPGNELALKYATNFVFQVLEGGF